MENLNCQYCNAKFTSIITLKNHQNKAKYCLIIQGKLEKKEPELTCDFCSKTLSSKQSLKNHIKTCEIIKEKEEKYFECNFCLKILSSKQNLFKHIEFSCYKKKEIEKDKERQLLKIKKKSEIQIVLKDKENEIDLLKKEKEKEIDLLKKEKEKEIDLLKKEKEKEIELLKKEKELLRKEKDREIKFINEFKENYKNQLQKKEEEILDLKDRLERMGTIAIKKPTTTNNKTINHVELNQFLSQEYINNKIISKFNDKYITSGMKGIVEFVDDHIIKLDNGSYIYGCYDYGRKMFKYKDNDGNEVKDPGAGKLIRMIQPGLLEQTKVLHQYFDNECNILEREEEKNGRLTIQEQKDLEKMKFLKDSANKTGMKIQTMHETTEFPNQLSDKSS